MTRGEARRRCSVRIGWRKTHVLVVVRRHLVFVLHVQAEREVLRVAALKTRVLEEENTGGERGEGRAAAAGGGGSELTCGSGTSACKTKVVVRV